MVHLSSLSSLTLSLALSFLLMTADVSSERIVSCSDTSVHRLSCESGRILVQAALYGRKDRETCSDGIPPQELSNTACSQPGTLDSLKKRCDGQIHCELNSKSIQTTDPCSGTSKYLETHYTCLHPQRLVVCENSLGHLHCDDGQVIYVGGAAYGRFDRDVCSYQRPGSQLQNVRCVKNVISKVAESCNGKNSCKVEASSALFNDPCVGTYKYLEMAYACHKAV